MSSGVMMGLQMGVQMLGGLAEGGAYKAQARADEENARLTDLQGAYDATDARHAARMQEGELATQLSGMGGTGSGTAGDILMQAAIAREYDMLTIRSNADAKAGQYRASARQNRIASRNAKINGVLSAASTAISGFRAEGDRKAMLGAVAASRSKQLSGYLPVPNTATSPRFPTYRDPVRSPWMRN